MRDWSTAAQALEKRQIQPAGWIGRLKAKTRTKRRGRAGGKGACPLEEGGCEAGSRLLVELVVGPLNACTFAFSSVNDIDHSEVVPRRAGLL